MKAPEKIYLEAVYPDNGVLPNGLNYTPSPTDIEYTRTDAFIEKVYDWLKNYTFVDDNLNVNLPTLLHDFLKDSRNF